MTEDLLHQIALMNVPFIGPVQAKILVAHFGNAKDVFSASRQTLEKIEGIGEVRAGSIKDFSDFKTAEDELLFVEKYKIGVVCQQDGQYPKRLLNCYDAPLLLYYRGTADLNAAKVISVIGTRNNTDYGRQVTEQLIQDLQSQQVLVVSGLAYGIDAIAHKAALQNNLRTIGVLAHGLDKIYPPQHAGLAKQMLADGGGLLTEFRRNTAPDRHNFPRRNRIVAGLADAVVVIETAEKGGSMITAELAIGYNRDVFACPGRVTDSKSAGCNHLIKSQKAILLDATQQLIEKLGWSSKKVKRKEQKELFMVFSDDEQALINILQQKETVHVDELFLKSGLTSSTVAASMLSLEFQNVVSSLPGKMYKLL